MIVLENSLEKKYTPKLRKMSELVDKNAQAMSDQEVKFTEFKHQMLEEVQKQVKKNCINEIKQYEIDKKKAAPQIMGLNEIVNGGELGLVKALSLKADQNDVEKLHEMKTNKIDSENMMNMLIEMNKILQHVITISNETIKINLIKANDTRVAKENKSHELIS